MLLERYAWLSVGAAVATIGLKTVAWWLTDSVGLLSDALESLVNLAAALLALSMLRLAASPPDDKYPHGFSKAEYFSGNPLSQWFMRLGGSLPIDRESAGAAQAMLDSAADLLDRGELFGIHPEGTRSPDGRLYRGKIGVAWLALKTGAPVLPVALTGTEKVLPVGAKVPRMTRIGIAIGKPMTFEGCHTSARDRRRVTDEIMAAIQELSGQEYVPSYAASRKPANGGMS